MYGSPPTPVCCGTHSDSDTAVRHGLAAVLLRASCRLGLRHLRKWQDGVALGLRRIPLPDFHKPGSGCGRRASGFVHFTRPVLRRDTPRSSAPALSTHLPGLPIWQCGFRSAFGVAQNGASVYGRSQGDNKTPLTMNWNVTISQALPGVRSLKSRTSPTRARTNGSTEVTAKLGNLNNIYPAASSCLIPTGSQHRRALPHLCPRTRQPAPAATQRSVHISCCGWPYAANQLRATFNANDYRPLNNYQDVYLLYSRQLRELQFAAGDVAEAVRSHHLPDELHVQQGSGNPRRTDRQRSRQWYRGRSLQHPEQLWSAGVRPHPHPEPLLRVEHAQVRSRQRDSWRERSTAGSSRATRRTRAARHCSRTFNGT